MQNFSTDHDHLITDQLSIIHEMNHDWSTCPVRGLSSVHTRQEAEAAGQNRNPRSPRPLRPKITIWMACQKRPSANKVPGQILL